MTLRLNKIIRKKSKPLILSKLFSGSNINISDNIC